MKKIFKKVFWAILFVCLFIALLAASWGVYMYVSNKKDSTPKGGIVRMSVPESEIAAQTSRTDMLEKAVKSVVGISSADAAAKNEIYMGSGVIASSDGYIITNQHVVGARPQRVEVTLYSGETVDGKTLWSNSALDIAIVKIKGNNYPTLKIGDAKKVRVGEEAVAIGNPLSMQFQRTVTAGIVSAVGRSISIESQNSATYMEDLIQTDASINPGNSGGPLINEDGEVIGINTVKVSSAEGMGFAVPVNICVPIIERLRNVGEFKTPYLGLYAINSAAAKYLDKSISFDSGMYIAKLDPYGPAFKAGLRTGDILKSIGTADTDSMLSLREELYKRQSGETVEIEFVRDGELRRVQVMLSSDPLNM